MDTRVAILAIVVEERDKAEELNHVLHAYGKYIIGRMGIVTAFGKAGPADEA